MNQEKLHLINKIFNNETIRTIWNKDEEKYYISVIDIVNALLEQEYQDSRNYWKVLKHRLKKEGNETVTNCNQLKLKARDDIEKKLGDSVISKDNALTYQYIIENNLIKNK